MLQNVNGPRNYYRDIKPTGKGVTVAVMDSGVATHPDLAGRVRHLEKFGHPEAPDDPVGHGTEVTGALAGSGSLSYGLYQGMAPEAEVVGIQIYHGNGDEEIPMKSIYTLWGQAIDWASNHQAEHNIKVLNISSTIPVETSLGFQGQTIFDPLAASIHRAVDSGIIVVAAAGNEQVLDMTPAINSEVITVGAWDNQAGKVADFSSRSQTLAKPDIYAPGVNVMTLNAVGSQLDEANKIDQENLKFIRQASPDQLTQVATQGWPELVGLGQPELRQKLLEAMPPAAETYGYLGASSAYMAATGTSIAAPIVAGTIALMLQLNPKLTQAEVRSILRDTATPIEGEQAGLLNVQAALDRVESGN